jgi:hypothetical protein
MRGGFSSDSSTFLKRVLVGRKNYQALSEKHGVWRIIGVAFYVSNIISSGGWRTVEEKNELRNYGRMEQ